LIQTHIVPIALQNRGSAGAKAHTRNFRAPNVRTTGNAGRVYAENASFSSIADRRLRLVVVDTNIAQGYVASQVTSSIYLGVDGRGASDTNSIRRRFVIITIDADWITAGTARVRFGKEFGIDARDTRIATLFQLIVTERRITVAPRVYRASCLGVGAFLADSSTISILSIITLDAGWITAVTAGPKPGPPKFRTSGFQSRRNSGVIPLSKEAF
jgi:hypothetical protein